MPGSSDVDPGDSASGRVPRSSTRTRWRELLPGGWSLIVILGLLAIGVAVSIVEGWSLIWWFTLGVLIAIAALDAVSVLREAPIAAERSMVARLPLGVPTRVSLQFDSAIRRPIRLLWFEHLPETFSLEGFPRSLVIPAGESRVVRYQTTPTTRGEHEAAPIEIRIRSRWRLWWRTYRAGDGLSMRVYPNFQPVLGLMQLGSEYRATIGIRSQRRRGIGLEFQQLRDYRQGDSLRQIDWRATARVRRPISRDYQEERDQRVIFLLDCGRRMRGQEEQIGHFDAALNAVLLCAYIALKQGDAVGCATIGGNDRWLAPVKGAAMINRVLNALYDLQPRLITPDYLETASALLRRYSKHALVFLVTNTRAEDFDDLLPALRVLQRRHRVVLASLQEAALRDAERTTVVDLNSAVTAAAAANYLAERRRGIALMRSQGVLTVDAAPDRLSSALANLYLQLKAASAV